MTIKEFIDVFKDNKCCITYDGSLDIKRKEELSSRMHRLYFDIICALVNEMETDLLLSIVDFAEVNPRGIKLQVQFNIETAIQMSINKRWKYSITYLPLVDNRAELSLIIWPSIGPVKLTVIEYM